MNPCRCMLPCLALLVSISGASAAPTINAVANAASNLVAGFPNAGIAQGAIFVVYGTGLGPTSLATASMPFQSTTVSNTSVAVTVNGTTVDALMYYTSATQVAALLPSNTPTGSGTITVTYNGQTSAQAPISVVSNNLGVFSVDSTGSGPSIVTYADYSLVSPIKATNCGGPYTTCGAANPNDTLILWATGLGPVSGTDASGSGLGQNMPNIPLMVWLGGVQAPVTYQGRSGCCIGEDQIVFTVPNNVPTGCAVPLVIQIGNEVSNTTLLPVANGSRSCTGLYLTPAEVQVVSTNSTFKFGDIELDHFSNDSGSGFNDEARFNFVKAQNIPPASQPFVATYLDNQPIGTCSVYIGDTAPGDAFTNNLNLTALDAGSTFTVQGPNGTMTVMAQTGDHPILSATGAFLAPGNYTITGSGGKDVGAFMGTITLPATPTLTSPTNPNGLTVTRSKGMTITWNAAPSGGTGHVEIVVSSATATSRATVTCTAPASAGTFTIPPYVMLALPAGTGTNFGFQPGDQAPASSSMFSATGLDAGILQTFVDSVGFAGFTLN